MSDDIIRDERGRIVKGSPGLHRKPDQDTQPDIPPAEPYQGNPDDSDAVIIYVSRNFGRQGLPKDGQIGYYTWLMKERPADFNAQHIKAVARKAEASTTIAAGEAGVKVFHIGMIPSHHYVTAEQMAVIQKADLHGEPSVEPPPPTQPPRTQPIIVSPPADDDEDQPALGPFLTKAEIGVMTEAEIAAAIKAGEIVFVGDDE